MKKSFFTLVLVSLSFSIGALEVDTPLYLYKVVAQEDWVESIGEPVVLLDEEDDDYIHFSKDDQLDSVLDRHWSGTPAVILKIDVSKLSGNLVCESDDSESPESYHLYDGEIPIDAVVEVTDWK